MVALQQAQLFFESSHFKTDIKENLFQDIANLGFAYQIFNLGVRKKEALMALHRGRIDLLEEHLKRDPQMLTRTFSHRDIYPVEMGCGEPHDATVGTPRR